MKFEQNRIVNIEFFFEKTHLREVGFAFFFFLLLVFELRLIQLLFHVCPSSQLPFISRSIVMGGRGVKLGKRVKWVYGRKCKPEGTRSSQVSDWVVFLVDFSSKLLAGIELNCLPRGFLWWAWTSLLEDTGVRVGEEWKKKKKQKSKKKRSKNTTLKYFQLSYSSRPQK